MLNEIQATGFRVLGTTAFAFLAMVSASGLI